jgi:hypothetical protein
MLCFPGWPYLMHSGFRKATSKYNNKDAARDKSALGQCATFTSVQAAVPPDHQVLSTAHASVARRPRRPRFGSGSSSESSSLRRLKRTLQRAYAIAYRSRWPGRGRKEKPRSNR